MGELEVERRPVGLWGKLSSGTFLSYLTVLLQLHKELAKCHHGESSMYVFLNSGYSFTDIFQFPSFWFLSRP